MTDITFTSLTVRKLADRSEGTRVTRFHPETGERMLVNPDTPGNEHEPWPLLGVSVEGEAPEYTRLPTKWVSRGVAEGWITLENPEPVFRPAGPTGNPWGVPPHVFTHVDSITIDTVDGPLVYKPFGTRGQPDKYDENDAPADPDAPNDGSHEVEHFYTVQKVAS
jgi:hypothetical protein